MKIHCIRLQQLSSNNKHLWCSFICGSEIWAGLARNLDLMSCHILSQQWRLWLLGFVSNHSFSNRPLIMQSGPYDGWKKRTEMFKSFFIKDCIDRISITPWSKPYNHIPKHSETLQLQSSGMTPQSNDGSTIKEIVSHGIENSTRTFVLLDFIFGIPKMVLQLTQWLF